MISLTAAGGVLYRIKEEICEVVLIYRNDVWDLPKGKKEEGETVEECAQREVAEEVGITLPELENLLATTYHEYEQNGKVFGKTTHWYRMKLTKQEDFTPQQTEGIEAVQWVELGKANRIVGYENLREVLEILKDSLK